MYKGLFCYYYYYYFAEKCEKFCAFFFDYKKSIVIWVELNLTLEVRITAKLVYLFASGNCTVHILCVVNYDCLITFVAGD